MPTNPDKVMIGQPGIHVLLARDVVAQWSDIDLAYQILLRQSRGVAEIQWKSARVAAARMYMRATQALGVPVDDVAFELVRNS